MPSSIPEGHQIINESLEDVIDLGESGDIMTKDLNDSNEAKAVNVSEAELHGKAVNTDYKDSGQVFSMTTDEFKERFERPIQFIKSDIFYLRRSGRGEIANAVYCDSTDPEEILRFEAGLVADFTELSASDELVITHVMSAPVDTLTEDEFRLARFCQHVLSKLRDVRVPAWLQNSNNPFAPVTGNRYSQDPHYVEEPREYINGRPVLPRYYGGLSTPNHERDFYDALDDLSSVNPEAASKVRRLMFVYKNWKDVNSPEAIEFIENDLTNEESLELYTRIPTIPVLPRWHTGDLIQGQDLYYKLADKCPPFVLSKLDEKTIQQICIDMEKDKYYPDLQEALKKYDSRISEVYSRIHETLY